MTSPEPWTVRRLLEWTTEHFRTHGSDSPRLDAEILLAAALGMKRIELYTHFETEPSESQRGIFREQVKRRAAGEPVAYLVGYKEFFSLPFLVNHETLIPRPETEMLVIEALDRLKTRSELAEPHIADVGAGSGCVAIAIAKNNPRTRITAIDRSTGALDVARQNAERHGVSDRVRCVASDLFAALPEEETFDMIVANPPYVSDAEYEQLPVSVKNFEPKSALVGGSRGTEIIARLIHEATGRLRSNGSLLIEFSPMIAADCRDLLTDGRWINTAILKDDARFDRILVSTFVAAKDS